MTTHDVTGRTVTFINPGDYEGEWVVHHGTQSIKITGLKGNVITTLFLKKNSRKIKTITNLTLKGVFKWKEIVTGWGAIYEDWPTDPDAAHVHKKDQVDVKENQKKALETTGDLKNPKTTIGIIHSKDSSLDTKVDLKFKT